MPMPEQGTNERAITENRIEAGLRGLAYFASRQLDDNPSEFHILFRDEETGEKIAAFANSCYQEGQGTEITFESQGVLPSEETVLEAIDILLITYPGTPMICNKSIIDELQRMLQLASSIRSLTGGGVPPLINYLANLKPGMSATSLLTRFIEKLEDSGVPTGDLPDGSPNLGVVIQQGFNQSLMDEIAENGKTEVTITGIEVGDLSLKGFTKVSGNVL